MSLSLAFIEQIKSEIEQIILDNSEKTEQFRLEFLSKKGKISQLFDDFKLVEPTLRKELGKPLNELKQGAEKKMERCPRKCSQQSQRKNCKTI
jgi:phenylalanyl-tRNA synthetase alpha chain